jgi:hypothetical protein
MGVLGAVTRPATAPLAAAPASAAVIAMARHPLTNLAREWILMVPAVALIVASLGSILAFGGG